MSNKTFFRMFIKQPLVNASITPSSKRAARKMVKGLNLGQMKFVVELGPGTGVFTEILSERLPSDCRVLLVELEESFIKNLENKYDHRFEVVQSSACKLDKLLRERCVENVDLVMGNSSSGIIEVPSSKTPTLDIGTRQFGRVKSKNIYSCELDD